jgi:hypothetical protein
VDIQTIGHHAVNYSRIFRHEIGGCDVSSPEKIRHELSAADLFCFNDEKVENIEAEDAVDNEDES